MEKSSIEGEGPSTDAGQADLRTNSPELYCRGGGDVARWASLSRDEPDGREPAG